VDVRASGRGETLQRMTIERPGDESLAATRTRHPR